MAYWELVVGAPGNGKSLYMARTTRWLVHRNRKVFEKYGIFRKVRANSRFSKKFENECKVIVDGKEESFLEYWNTMDDILRMRNVDIVWDEIATNMDAREAMTLPPEVKRFLSQFRKRGLEIYANTQDFSFLDKRARYFITDMFFLSKIIGSPDPSPTKPPVKKIWGWVAKRRVKPESMKAENPEQIQFTLIPSFFPIKKEDTEMYDTLDDIPASPPIPKLKQATKEIYKGGTKDGEEKEIYV